jgi:hypothetical protein
MEHVEEFKLELADFATQTRSIELLQALTAACERTPFNAYSVREKYLQSCDFISMLLQNCDHDEKMLVGLDRTESVESMLRTVQEARQAIWRAVTAVECRLITSGALSQPGVC